MGKEEEEKENEGRAARSLISLAAAEISRWLDELTKRKIGWKHENEGGRIGGLCTDE